jgi:replication factor C subunit 1
MFTFRPSAAQIKPRIVSIAKTEGLTCDSNTIEELVQITQGDIRQILNILQSFSLTQSHLSYDQTKEFSKKNVEMNPFDISNKLLSPHGCSLEGRFELYFADYQLMPAFIQENYIKLGPRTDDSTYLTTLAEAADTLAEGEVIEKYMFS